jgi:hypothetical protein
MKRYGQAVPRYNAAAEGRLGRRFSLRGATHFYALFLLSVLGAYLYTAQRRVYGEGRGPTLLKCLALILAVAAVTLTYRLALFFTAFFSV